MTKDFETLLKIFGASSLGKELNIKQSDNPETLIRLSANQGVFTVVYPELSKIANVQSLYGEFLSIVSKSISQNEFTLTTLKKAEEKGLFCALMKGAFAASMYHNPDLRISSDTDILIKPKDKNNFISYLEGEGYYIEPFSKNANVITATHKLGGTLEVHLSLYNDLNRKTLFGGKKIGTEDWIRTIVCKKEMYTLSIRDNLLFLTTHFIKHFLTGGASIRHIMDMCLYMDKYKDKIDFEEFGRLLRDLRFDVLVSAAKSVAAKYFGMDFEIEDEKNMELLLNDIEDCGIFGIAKSTSPNIIMKVRYRRKSLSKFRIKLISSLKKESNIIWRLFPSQRCLLDLGYDYAKCKALIPIAWVHKFFRQLKCHLTEKEKYAAPEKDSKLLEKREELMQKLSIID